MGVKSTVELTRADAEARARDLFLKYKAFDRDGATDMIFAAATYSVSDEELSVYKRLDALVHEREWSAEFDREYPGLSDKSLEIRLMQLNDLLNGGEGYDNYSIVENPSNLWEK